MEDKEPMIIEEQVLWEGNISTTSLIAEEKQECSEWKEIDEVRETSMEELTVSVDHLLGMSEETFERLRRKRKIVKDWWHRTFLKKLQKEGVEKMTLDECKRYFRKMIACGEDKELMELMEKELSDEFPGGSAYQVMPRDQLQRVLWKGMKAFYERSRNMKR